MAKEKSKQEATTPNTGARGATKSSRKSNGTKAKGKTTRAKTGTPKARKPSGLDAAAKVLKEAGEPLTCRQIVERAFEKSYWKSGGKTPHATIYSAILREIQKKGDKARFRKTSRGKFDLAS